MQPFQTLVEYTITSRIHHDEAQAINLSLIRSGDYRRSELIRYLQIFRDSIEIALVSKRREIAEERLNTVADMYVKALGYDDLLSSGNRQLLEDVFIQSNIEFYNVFYLNLAAPHIEKAKTLKTERGRMNRWNQAREILEEGLSDPCVSDTSGIKAAIAQIPVVRNHSVVCTSVDS